ncbi:hypothetical protein HK101_010710 [Irineochytrium annulatum]|nr:hypothetical protein HK101_010710 [Irineochytrium annulatum]
MPSRVPIDYVIEPVEVPGMPSFHLAIVGEGFTPMEEDEIALKLGDVVQVHRVFDDGWAYGVNRNTFDTGIFPVVVLSGLDPAGPYQHQDYGQHQQWASSGNTYDHAGHAGQAGGQYYNNPTSYNDQPYQPQQPSTMTDHQYGGGSAYSNAGSAGGYSSEPIPPPPQPTQSVNAGGYERAAYTPGGGYDHYDQRPQGYGGQQGGAYEPYGQQQQPYQPMGYPPQQPQQQQQLQRQQPYGSTSMAYAESAALPPTVASTTEPSIFSVPDSMKQRPPMPASGAGAYDKNAAAGSGAAAAASALRTNGGAGTPARGGYPVPLKEVDDSRFRRYRNNSCCRGWRCCLWIILIFILAIVAVVVFFLIYGIRIPKITVQGVTLDPNNPFSVRPPFDAFNISLLINAQVENNNFFNLLFDEIDVDAYNSNFNSGNSPIAHGQQGNSTDRVKIFGNAKTNVTLPTTIAYNSTKDPGLTFLNYLLNTCDGGAASNQLALNLKVYLHFTLISFLKYAPSVDAPVSFACPAL